MKIAKLGQQPEIFFTIQGEGKNIGMPSIFIRSSLCNLHCVWCDTPYTWNWHKTPFVHEKQEKFSMNEQIVEMTTDEIVKELFKYPCKHLVFTGGEPMLQQDGWIALMKVLSFHDYTCEVETNGTLIPKPELDVFVSQYNVSPKLDNSGNAKPIRERKAVYEWFAKSEKAIFKFVIASEKDIEEVLGLVEQYTVPANRVYLMPEGQNEAKLNEKAQWLAEICKTHGFFFTTRLHVLIYGGAKRGV